MTKTIGEVINESGLSLVEMAKATGLSYTTIWKFATGKSKENLSLRTIKRVASVVGIDASEIEYNPKPRKVPVTQYGDESICWRCINAVPCGKIGCIWSRSLIPVVGWEAKESEKNKSGYKVTDCPQYIPDDGVQRARNHDGLKALGLAVIKCAAQDYMTECKREARMREMDAALLTKRNLYRNKFHNIYDYEMEYELKRLEHFFKSQYAEGLADVNCEFIVSRIRSEFGI